MNFYSVYSANYILLLLYINVLLAKVSLPHRIRDNCKKNKSEKQKHDSEKECDEIIPEK